VALIRRQAGPRGTLAQRVPGVEASAPLPGGLDRQAPEMVEAPQPQAGHAGSVSPVAVGILAAAEPQVRAALA
jgi:hypothetical protein